MNGPTLLRRYSAVLSRPDERTLTGRVVPYDEITDVVDVLEDGSLDSYREGFRRGVFDRAAKDPRRIRLIDGHAEHGPGPHFGIATELRSDETGLDVDFRILPTRQSDLETMLDVGVTDLSVGFRPVKGGTDVARDGVRWRTRAVLIHVALEPTGSYPGAEVLAYRGELAVAEVEREYDDRVRELAEFAARARARQAELDEMLSRRTR